MPKEAARSSICIFKEGIDLSEARNVPSISEKISLTMRLQSLQFSLKKNGSVTNPVC